MSGFTGILLASTDFRWKYSYAVTNSSGQIGYNTGDTISPGSIYLTRSIQWCVSLAANYDLSLQIAGLTSDGDPGQSYFTQILVKDDTGVWRNYTSASASYIFNDNSSGADRSFWTWGTGSNRVYTGTSASDQRLIIIP